MRAAASAPVVSALLALLLPGFVSLAETARTIETPQAGTVASISLAEYRLRLETIAESLRRGDLPAARSGANDLLSSNIDSGSGAIAADASVLEPVQKIRLARDARRAARRISLISAALDGARKTQVPVDAKLLASLRASEQIPGGSRGGEVPGVPIVETGFWERFAETFTEFLRWIADRIADLFNWLSRFWPSARRPGESGPGGVPLFVTVLLSLVTALLALAAIHVVRRGRRAAAPGVAASTPATSKRDEDPLSREAPEWETYAAALEASGRLREAIRAWYHAVLVSLYRSGALHYRKGRTNWEYVSSLSPAVSWRGRFIDLTRRFEQEWYGRRGSDIETLSECAENAKTILAEVRARRGSA